MFIEVEHQYCFSYEHQYCVLKGYLLLQNTVEMLRIVPISLQSVRIIFHASNAGELDFLEGYCGHRDIDGLVHAGFAVPLLLLVWT